MSTENAALEVEELFIRLSHEGDVNHIVWSGISEIQDPEHDIGPFLRGLIPQLGGRKTIIDFRPLEYMNSATLQPIFQLLKELSHQKIETVLLYDRGVEWQRLSFRSITAVVTNLPNVTIATS